MEERDKYYTPDISELYVGYEYEERWVEKFPWEKVIIKNGDWINRAYTYFHKLIGQDLGVGIRTKYLDQQDIESLGWKLVDKEEKQYSTWCKFKNKDWELYVQLNDKYFPRLLNLKAQGHCYWKGNIKAECKSINELKTIMRFLNIK